MNDRELVRESAKSRKVLEEEKDGKLSDFEREGGGMKNRKGNVIYYYYYYYYYP